MSEQNSRAENVLPAANARLVQLSLSVFRVGLALVTFEQIRPLFGIQLSDYFFFLALLMFLPIPAALWKKAQGSGILLAGLLITLGALLSVVANSTITTAAGSLLRLIVLFGLFAPLAIVHAGGMLTNMLFLIGGITANCCVALFDAWILPGTVETLSINAIRSEMSYGERLQGLTSHPNILGLSAALGLLVAAILLLSGVGHRFRGRLLFAIVACSLAGLASGSRTFVVAIVPGFIVFALLQKAKARAVFRTAMALVVSWVILTYVVPGLVSQYSERLSATGSDYAPDYGRYVTAGLTVLAILDRPVVGWGVDHFDDAGLFLDPETGELEGVHNTFLKYWYAAGLLGGVGFLALFAVPARRLIKLFRNGTGPGSVHMIRLALAGYTLLFIVTNVAPITFNRFVYVPMFLFAGLAVHTGDFSEARAAAE